MPKTKTKPASLGFTYVPSTHLLGGKDSLTALETEYQEILSAEKELSERKSLVVEFVRKEMDRTDSETFGKFSKQVRKTLSWRTDDIVALFPKKFMAFLKPDASLLKIEMDDEPKLGKLAVCKETVAIVYSKA